MATLYESYAPATPVAILWVRGVNWGSQTFTPAAHTVTSVKILSYRVGSPGTVTVSIRATAGGLPTGADLCSGTIDGNTFTTDVAGALYEITLGAGTLLAVATLYAIVVRATAGDNTNYIFWMGTVLSGYAGGTAPNSTNSGVNWTDNATYDCAFEDWGYLSSYDVTATDGVTLGDTPSNLWNGAASVTDGIVLGDTSLGNINTNLSTADGVVLGDTPTGNLTTNLSATDGVVLGDTPTGSVTVSFSLTDGIILGDFAYHWFQAILKGLAKAYRLVTGKTTSYMEVEGTAKSYRSVEGEAK